MSIIGWYRIPGCLRRFWALVSWSRAQWSCTRGRRCVSRKPSEQN